MKIARALVRYHGGKYKLATWIVGNMPSHRVYVEPFGGGASVLLRKPRAYAEVYNDKCGDMVNMMTVVRDHGAELQRRIELTPFARMEYEACKEPSSDPIERARRLIGRSFMGFGSGSIRDLKSGFRDDTSRDGSTPAHDWANYPKNFMAIVDRMRGVLIECKDALEVMGTHDSPDTLHYVDPPYVHATRAKGKRTQYAYEMTDTEHVALIEYLRTLKGKVLLSGYDHPIYNEGLSDWRTVKKSTHADGGRPRVETLWLNPQAIQKGLFN